MNKTDDLNDESLTKTIGTPLKVKFELFVGGTVGMLDITSLSTCISSIGEKKLNKCIFLGKHLNIK